MSLWRAKDVDEEMDRFEEMALLNLDARREYLEAQTNLIKLELREQSRERSGQRWAIIELPSDN